MFGDTKRGQAINKPELKEKTNEGVDPFARIKKLEKTKLEEKIAEVIKPLQELDKKERSKIPVEYFSKGFADDFAHMIDTNSADEKKIREWISLAGGANREVDLVDTDGKVVDTVPKLIGDIPPLDEKTNKKVKEIAVDIVLDQDNATRHPLVQEANERDGLTSIGKALYSRVVSHPKNVKDSEEFKRVVSKYKTKLTDAELKEKVDLAETDTTNYDKYIID